ncbi:MAG: SRPBCC family protein [Bacteroidetes bacterium]|nr:SRPBCC family protein [Bacteroidota bacterium]
MKVLRTELILPISIQQAWDFFSTPKNLNEISPDDVVFKIISAVPEKMYEGLFITYKVSPLLGIPLNWVTEITHVNEPYYFVDEQRQGPYSIWHHEHHFKKVAGGVLMTDILHYDVGLSFIGWIVEKLFVDKKVNEIFAYRTEKLKQLFPAKQND